MTGHDPQPLLLDIATAYQRSAVLFALVEFGLPDALVEPATLQEAADAAGAEPKAVRALLEAAVVLGVVVRDGDRYRNGPDAARHLVRGAPAYLGDVVLRHARASRAAPWTTLARSLRDWSRGGTAAGADDGSGFDPDLRGQHALALVAGDALAGAIDLSPCRRLVDLGGGTGAMAIALCLRYPALRAIVLERGDVVPRARAFVRDSGASDRIDVREADVLHDAMPAGCDAALAANLLSMLDEAAARELVSRVREALPSGGVLVLSGWMRDTTRDDDVLATLLGVEDMALGAPDVERPVTTYARWLAELGYDHVRTLRYRDPFCAVVGTKP